LMNDKKMPPTCVKACLIGAICVLFQDQLGLVQ